MVALLFVAISLMMDYVKNKDLVMEVEATVIDSVNYLEESNDKFEITNYQSTITCEWEVDGKKYNDKFTDSGTYLKGNKVTIDVFKDDPSIVKNISISNVIGSIIILIVAGFIFYVLFSVKKYNEKLALIEEQKYKKQDQQYIDLAEEKNKIRKIGKRIFLLKLALAIIIFIIAAWVTKNGVINYYYDNNRKSINVECLVKEADNYTVADKEYSDIQGQWEIDGQVYKKVLTNLPGKYLEGKTYNIQVEKDTEETMKISSKPKLSFIVESSLLSIGSIVVIIILIKKWNKEKARNIY
jgi:cell division protein FtsB